VLAAASRMASLSVDANPATIISTPSTLVDDSHHHGRASSVGATRRPTTIRVSEVSSMPMGFAG
jgi:hypothetical protein